MRKQFYRVGLCSVLNSKLNDLFSVLWAKWVYHFTLACSLGGILERTGFDGRSAHAPKALSVPVSALFTSHVAALSWQSLAQFKLSAAVNFTMVRRKTRSDYSWRGKVSRLSIRRHLLLKKDIMFQGTSLSLKFYAGKANYARLDFILTETRGTMKHWKRDWRHL